MNFKKVFFAGIAATSLIVSAAAFASTPSIFVTTNHSGDYSTVKLGTLCAGALGDWTGPNKTILKTPMNVVKGLCHGAAVCTASLYIGGPAEEQCAGTPVGSVTINTRTGMVTANPTTAVVAGKSIAINGSEGQLTLK